MKKLVFGAVLMTLIAAAAPARAQDEKKVHVNIGGGVTMPVSTIKDEFSTGGGFNLGVSFDPSPTFGVHVEYGYNGLSGKDRQLTLFPTPNAAIGTTGLIQSHHAMHFIDFNGVVRPGGESKVKPYGIGGFGMYYRTISLTTPDVGYATVCDPYWYVCFPAAVPVDRIIGDRNSWDPGFNLGGGITFAIGDSAQFYVEGRWHYMWGPEFTDGAGNKQNANAQYFPITFGFRF